MTRINVGVEPHELCRQHLLAEHREIKRIPNVVASGKYSLQGMPDKFKLGTGHVKFFTTNLDTFWIDIKRYMQSVSKDNTMLKTMKMLG